MKHQNDGNSERQFFCRLHEGDSLFICTLHGNKRSKEVDSRGKMISHDKRNILEKTCTAVAGFYQPQPFITLYQVLGMLEDGFTYHISTCIVKSVILCERKIEEWNERLMQYSVNRFKVDTKSRFWDKLNFKFCACCFAHVFYDILPKIFLSVFQMHFVFESVGNYYSSPFFYFFM